MHPPDPADPKATPGGKPSGEPPRGGADSARPGNSHAGSPGSGRAGSGRAGGGAERTGDPGTDAKSAGERFTEARDKLGSASKKVGHASKVGATGVASASKKTAAVGGKVGRATGRRISGLTGAQGARESGLSRLIELGAVNAAGDTAFAVSLAGTVFFTVPSDQARDRVALFLLLTMAPFALMAPLIGPILDRFRHGRRWAIGATLGLRGFLVWSLAASISGNGSAWLYPAALGCLVASKAYGVTRASAVPRLLPKEITLVTANSRISLAGVAGATIGAGLAAGFAAIGPQWSLRWAAVVYTIGLILAIRLPSAVDSPAGEEMTGTAGRDARRRAITAAVARGIRCNLGLRFVSGFLTMYLAFLLRDKPISGIDGAIAAGAVIAAAGLGNSAGTLVGSLLKARKPEGVVLIVLLADAAVAVGVAVFYGLPLLIALGLIAGLCSSLGKLSLDAMIQRDVPESVRTSVFARSETVLQLAWVIGGGCGIVLPLIPRLGFGFLAAVLLVAVFFVLRMRPTDRPTEGPLKPGGLGGPRSGGADHSHPQASEHRSESTSRTILTTSVAEQRANRAQRSGSHDEATIEWKVDPRKGPQPDARPEQPVGRWWSGQPEDDADDTVEDKKPWAEEPTVERERDRGGLFNRRRPNGRRPPR